LLDSIMNESKRRIVDMAIKAGMITRQDQGSDSKGVRAKRRKYIHGNYPSYYKNRKTTGNVTKDNADPRLTLIKEKHLEDQRILDIGCNTGQVTLELATTYKAKEVLGIDIDSGLIARAKRGVENVSHLQFEVVDILK